MPADAALAALGALAEPDPDGPWTAAASLRYLCVLAGHACDLARRGRMLPQLVIEAGEPAARWRPVLTGADAAAFRDFAAAMPPVCRAGRREPHGAARECCGTRSRRWSTPPPGPSCRSGCWSGTGPAPRRRCPTAGCSP